MSRTAAASCDDVSRTYASGGLLAPQAIRAVRRRQLLDSTPDRPEIFTIIGESGSGKTTLARMILNMVPPSAGTIRFRGTTLARMRGAGARGSPSCARCSRSSRTRSRRSIR